jgi:type VI secretion system protein ImpF
MAELTPRERLQPSLLDRLTDDEPDKRHESAEKRVLSMRQLRLGVLRDLGWLFNTGNLASAEDLSDSPLVARSVLNYGVPDLTGRIASGISPKDLVELLRQAVIDFEPRILSRSVRVRALVAADQMNRNAIAFEIEGELWGQPMPSHFLVRSEIDCETGHISIEGDPRTAAGLVAD